MKRIAPGATLVAATLAAVVVFLPTAQAQQASPAPVIAVGASLLSVQAEGRSTRKPDLAVFNAGVTTQGQTAGAALSANSAAMTKVIAELKRAGIAERDIQTSNLSVNPIYAQQRPLPDGTIDRRGPEIIGYQVSNNVTVRQRKLDNYGKVIDTLVSAGANQVNGPSFQMDDPDPAMDEARVSAMGKARARADLYAKAAGLRVVRILSISESGGYSGPPVMYARVAADSMAAAPPVQAGELQVESTVTVQFELAP
jgi:uncharacterized protein YggE